MVPFDTEGRQGGPNMRGPPMVSPPCLSTLKKTRSKWAMGKGAHRHYWHKKQEAQNYWLLGKGTGRVWQSGDTGMWVYHPSVVLQAAF